MGSLRGIEDSPARMVSSQPGCRGGAVSAGAAPAGSLDARLGSGSM